MKKCLVLLFLFTTCYSQAQRLILKTKFGTGNRTRNYKPIANAGTDIVINLPATSTTLSGSGTDVDGNITAYFWRKISGGAATINNASASSTLVTGLAQGVYSFELKVTDNLSATGLDTVQVTVNGLANAPPTANAGNDTTITLPSNTANLSGSGTDTDGTISSYGWAKISGPAGGTLSNTAISNPTVSALQEGTYQFELTVTDNSGSTGQDVMQIIVLPAIPPANINPIANAGPNQTITLPTNTATLAGSGTDSDGTIAGYGWVKLSGPAGGTLSNASIANPSLSALQSGIYQYQLTVTDNLGATGTSVVVITVNAAVNIPPLANAGPDQNITLPTSTVSLSGSGTDADGTITTYRWDRSSGPLTYIITTPNSAATTITGLTTAGIYKFQLTVTDNNGSIATDLVIITVNADPSVLPMGWFTYTSVDTFHTSAGVYAFDSTLVRILWQDSVGKIGTHLAYWDGNDDKGILLVNPDSNYQIRVLKNNVKYQWMGTLGNTSDSMTGNSKHQTYYSCMNDIAFASNGWAYFVNGFSEGEATYSKFNIATPNQKVNFYGSSPSRVISLNSEYITTDNINVYIGGYDSYSVNNSMVHAIRTSDDANVTFSSGTSYQVTHGILLNSAIAKNASNQKITGLAVMYSGNYLFVARGSINQLMVHNKTTGAVVQTLTYTNPRALEIDPSSDNLWMLTGTNTVAKYTVNVDGTLTAPVLSIAGLIKPRAISASFDGTRIRVSDDTARQQVFEYNATTGAAVSTLGVAGGYVADATVSNTKFYFHDSMQGPVPTFISYQIDGTFWVGDGGNSRAQHYNSANTYINRIQCLRSPYYVYADLNAPTRVLAGPLEFTVDYSQPLSGSTGWALTKNWGANMPPIGLTAGVNSNYNWMALYYPVTMSNGRTYAILRENVATNNREIVELSATGQLRFTGVKRTGAMVLDKDGGYQTYTKGVVGGISKVNRYALTGFSSNNPVWNPTVEVLATTPTLTNDDPNDILTGNTITSSGKVIIYSPDAEITSTPLVPADGYHWGALWRNGTRWISKSEMGTFRNYTGKYPPVGYFDDGNLVNNTAGGTVSIFKNTLATSYHGEGWKNLQTNKYNYYLDDGLGIGQFGVTKDQTTGNSPFGYEGNALTPMVVYHPLDSTKAVLFHGGESTHSAVHMWIISGLNTLSESTQTLAYPATFVQPVFNYTNLMSGLQFDVPLVDSSRGWTRYPKLNQAGWNVYTGRKEYRKTRSADVSVIFAPTTAQTDSVSRSLGVDTATSSWQIQGEVAFNGTANRASISAVIEILDVNGKVLANFYQNIVSAGVTTLYGNGVAIKSGSPPAMTDSVKNLKPFEINIVGGTVSFKYGTDPTVTSAIFDGTGNWRKPATIRIKCVSNPLLGPLSGKDVDVNDWIFIIDGI